MHNIPGPDGGDCVAQLGHGECGAPKKVLFSVEKGNGLAVRDWLVRGSGPDGTLAMEFVFENGGPVTVSGSAVELIHYAFGRMPAAPIAVSGTVHPAGPHP